jgi:hypothetical protein
MTLHSLLPYTDLVTLPPHGISTRSKRLSLIAGYRAPDEPPADPEPDPHIDIERPGELVGVDCFYVGWLHGTNGAIWQLTAIDCYSSYAWAELVRCPDGAVTQAQTPRLVQRVARDCEPLAGACSAP